jgi:hypothetical protein
MSATLESIDFAGKIDDRQSKVPALDGYRATNLKLRFSGAATLDQTSKDDLDILAAARLGREVRLIVVAEGSSKGFALARKPHDDDDLSFTLTLKVVSVEAAEIA